MNGQVSRLGKLLTAADFDLYKLEECKNVQD